MAARNLPPFVEHVPFAFADPELRDMVDCDSDYDTAAGLAKAPRVGCISPFLMPGKNVVEMGWHHRTGPSVNSFCCLAGAPART